MRGMEAFPAIPSKCVPEGRRSACARLNVLARRCHPYLLHSKMMADSWVDEESAAGSGAGGQKKGKKKSGDSSSNSKKKAVSPSQG